MKKSTVLLYSVIAIAVLLLITVSIFFGQKRYYEKKAVENTRFITMIKNLEIDQLNIKMGDLTKTTLKNTVWKQSKIKGDKYFVTCTGDYHGINVKMEFYIHENNKLDKLYLEGHNNFYIRKEGQIVQTNYAFYIIGSEYMSIKGIQIPSKIKATRNILTVLHSNNLSSISQYEINYNAYMKALDDIQFLNAIEVYDLGLRLNDIIEQYYKENPNIPKNKRVNLLEGLEEDTSSDIYENDPELNEYD